MKTVLGLSATSGGVGWVLIDQRAGAGDGFDLLDDDAFEVDDAADLARSCAAAARGARGIAASSGDEIGVIGLICSDDVDARVDAIVAALASAGFDDVRTVPRELLVGGVDGDVDRGDNQALEGTALEDTALAAARAVATGVVSAARVRCLLPPCRHRSTVLRIAGTAAAAAIVALTTVGSTFLTAETEPAQDPGLSAAGPLQIVTAAVPHAPHPAPVRTVSKSVRQSTVVPAPTERASAPQVLFARPQSQPVPQAVQQATPERVSAIGVQHLQNPVAEFAPPTPHLPESLPAGTTPMPGAPPLPGPVEPQALDPQAESHAPAPQAESQMLVPQAAELLPEPALESAPPAEAQVPALVPRPVSLNPLVSGLP